MLNYLQTALYKAITPNTESPSPPVFSLLIAEDLGGLDSSCVNALASACAYFYIAADLLDDVQDNNTNHPLFQLISKEQALNVSNLLLMGAYQSIGKSGLPFDKQGTLVHYFTQMGIKMTHGQYWDIASTNASKIEHTPEKITAAKAGAEIGTFLACIPIALYAKPQVDIYYQIGEKIGFLLQTFSDYFDIWIVPNKYALSDDLSVLKNSLPIYSARKDNQWGNDVEDAFSGKNHWPQKQYNLRRLLSKTNAVEAFELVIREISLNLADYYKQANSLPNIQSLSNYYLEQSQHLCQGLKKLQELSKAEIRIFRPSSQNVLRQAVEYLTFLPQFEDAWEIQRWGFLDQTTLYGDIFNPLLILEALKAYGHNIDNQLKGILRKNQKKGWHYFSNTDLIPTDSDDLGQILHMCSHFPREHLGDSLDIALDLLLKNISSSGKCPTWLCDEENFYRKQVDAFWYGNYCIAVMANLYYGLSTYDKDNSYQKVIQQGIKYILEKYNKKSKSWQSAYYVSENYTRYLVARLLQHQNTFFDFSDAIQLILSQQQLDGGWMESPQETAFVILFFNEIQRDDKNHILSSAIHKAQNYLIDTQSYDGSWKGENLFKCPGNQNSFELFNHPKLTTAFCIRALL